MAKRWTEGRIEKHLRSIMADCGQFPTYRSLLDQGKGGLVDAIQRSGGQRVWVERLGVTSRRENWTDDLIEERIIALSENSGLMPTASEMREAGDGALSSAVSRHPLQFRGWARRLGLRMQNSSTQRSYRMECRIRDRLQALGFRAETTRNKESYDLVVDDTLCVEVKMAREYIDERYGSDAAYMFQFGPQVLHRMFDLAVLVCVDNNDEPRKTYLIPEEHCRQQTVTITGSNRWRPWLERWSLIGELLAKKRTK